MRISVICSGLLTATTLAQPCTPQWLPGDTIAGASGAVNKLVLWDSDGPGPLPTRLIAGGEFTSLGAAVARGLAIRTAPDTWAELAGGVTGNVQDLLVLPDGRLLVAGAFQAVGNSNIANLAVLDHTGTWTTIEGNSSGGISGFGVNALTRLSSGDIVVGGTFTTVGPQALPIRNLARWNGTDWSAFGTGPSSTVTRLAARGNGFLISGSFTTIDGQPLDRLARFDGSQWQPVPTPSALRSFTATFLVRADGWFLIGTDFQGQTGFGGGTGTLGIAAYDANAQLTAIPPLGGPVTALLELPDGRILASGRFFSNSTAPTTTPETIFLPQAAIFDGNAWSPLGDGLYREGTLLNFDWGPRTVIIDHAQDIVVGGVFETPAFRNIARLRSNNAWAPAAAGTTVPTFAAASRWVDSSILLVGSFTSIGGVAAPGIAAFNGVQWTAPIPAPPTVSPFERLGFVTHTPTESNPSTILVTTAGGVRRWNGSAWRTAFELADFAASSIGFGITSLRRSPNGSIVLGVATQGFSSLLQPRRTVYRLTVPEDPNDPRAAIPSPLPPYPPQLAFPFPGASTTLVLPLDDGSVVTIARLGFDPSGAGPQTIWRWSGASWTQLGPQFNSSITALAQLPDGRIVAANTSTDDDNVPTPGSQTIRRRVISWNGTSWQTLGQPLEVAPVVARGIHSLLVRPDGSLIAGGSIAFGTGPQAATRLARWTPETNTWLPFADPISPVTQLINLPNNELFATTIGFAGSHPAAGYARLGCSGPLCPANCDGSFTPALSPADFTCFLNNYRANNPAADCDASGTLNAADFTCFLAKYRAGCP